jgi:hypothetical protein
MCGYAYVFDRVVFLIGNDWVNNVLINVLERCCGARPMYGNINILVLRSLLVHLTGADPVDDGRTEITCVI